MMNLAEKIKNNEPRLAIGGLLKFSTLDYPGKLSAVVFCQGCPHRCVYCHNPDFIDPNGQPNETFSDLIDFLETRKGLLEAVVFSGGDPLIQPSLCEAMQIVKDMGFLIGIHTSGPLPKRFAEVLKIADWVGFDIKTLFDKYEKITQIPNSGNIAKQSFEMLINSGVSYEVRTTVDSRNISFDDLIDIAKMLKSYEVKRWVLQECILRKPTGDEHIPLPTSDEIAQLSQILEIEVRRQ